jgi:hypothetical protein
VFVEALSTYTGPWQSSAPSAEILLIEVALASGKIEIITKAESFQDRLDVSGEL